MSKSTNAIGECNSRQCSETTGDSPGHAPPIPIHGELRWGRDRQDVDKQLAIVEDRLEFYAQQLRQHPIVALIEENAVPKSIFYEYASVQYADSLLWIPMLALLKDRVGNGRLHKALKENLFCEAGAEGWSHVEICRQFIESVGVNLDGDDFKTLASNQVVRSLAVADLSEGQIAGWILAAETLVPLQFSLFREGYVRTKGVNLSYLDEHIAVDADEHAVWMREACRELLAEKPCLEEIISGVDIGGRVQLRDPDTLYAKTLRANKLARHGGVIYPGANNTQAA